MKRNARRPNAPEASLAPDGSSTRGTSIDVWMVVESKEVADNEFVAAFEGAGFTGPRDLDFGKDTDQFSILQFFVRRSERAHGGFGRRALQFWPAV